MSASGSTNSSSTWDEIISGVEDVVNVLAPIAESAIPAAATAISIGQKIIQGVIAAEPEAVSLYKQITSGTPPTAAQLSTYAANYETVYQQLNNDINAALAKLPATS